MFSPGFPVGGCVKVSGGFLYKLPSIWHGSRDSRSKGVVRPFAGRGFVKQNLGWELAHPGLPPLRTSPPKYLPAGKKIFTSFDLPGKSLASKKKAGILLRKTVIFHLPYTMVAQPFLSQPVKKPPRKRGLATCRPKQAPFSADGEPPPLTHKTAPVGPVWPASGNTTA